jgi:DNA-binding CsgD family transcriptional regulator
MLLGRRSECSKLECLLEETRQGASAALVLCGEAGIGKSALLHHAAERARECGLTVLSARGAESESELPFSGLSELLAPIVHLLERIPEPQAVALRGAFALGRSTAGDPFATFAATLSLLSEAADDRPLLAMVDDAHWLDASSSHALMFAARRLESEGVLLLFAAREGVPSALDAADLPTLQLDALDPDSSRQVLARAANGEIAPHVTEALLREARGNPLALLELPAALPAVQLAGTEPLEDPLPLGPGLERAFQRRLAALPASTRGALLVAAASDGGAVGEILDAARRLALEPEVLEPAEREGLVTIDGGELRWRHPLLRSAAYRAASAPDRRSAHRALADALEKQGDSDRRAWHLAATVVSADEEVASLLEQTALRARERRGHAAAAKALERAAELTPDPELRARRLLETARDAMLAGHSSHALVLLDEALELGGHDPLLRADIQQLRGQVEMWESGPSTAYDLMVSEAERVEPHDPDRAALMLSAAALTCTMTGDVARVVATGRRGWRISRRAGAQTKVEAEAMLGNGLLLSGDAAGAMPHLRRLRSALNQEQLLMSPGVIHAAGHGSVWVEDYTEARQLIEATVAAARSTSAGGLLSFPLSLLAELDFRTGRWTEAYAEAAEAVRVAEDAGQLNQAGFAFVCWAYVEAAQGREDDCREHVQRSVELAMSYGSDSILTYADSVLGLLELGQARPEAALPHLESAARRMELHGVGEPGIVWWPPDLVESYHLLGRTEEARETLRVFEQAAERTKRTWAQATVARCRGMLADDVDFEREFDAALQWHAQTPTPFERARTELRLGERLRRVRRLIDARGPLRRALATFDRLGAGPWGERARAELAAAGDRVREAAGADLRRLTAQELQVALRVAEGRTNREVAAALFLSPKTVEYHLHKVYDKLGVRSRTELAKRL